MRCHYKISKKGKKNCFVTQNITKNIQTRLVFFNFKQIETLLINFPLFFFFCFFQHQFLSLYHKCIMAKREKAHGQMQEKEKSTRSEEREDSTTAIKAKKLKHAVHHLRINTHKYKSSKRQNSTKESRKNNKLAAHRRNPVRLTYCQGRDFFFPFSTFVSLKTIKFHKIKAPFFL